jgi:hypothetical protein
MVQPEIGNHLGMQLDEYKNGILAPKIYLSYFYISIERIASVRNNKEHRGKKKMMKKIVLGILIVGLIVAGVGSGFLVADYSYQEGYSSGYAIGYSKGHFEGFTAGEAVQNNLMLCELIELDIALG